MLCIAWGSFVGSSLHHAPTYTAQKDSHPSVAAEQGEAAPAGDESLQGSGCRCERDQHRQGAGSAQAPAHAAARALGSDPQLDGEDGSDGGKGDGAHKACGTLGGPGVSVFMGTRAAVAVRSWHNHSWTAGKELLNPPLPDTLLPMPTGDDLEEGHQAGHERDEGHKGGAPGQAQGHARQPGGPAVPALQIFLDKAQEGDAVDRKEGGEGRRRAGE